MGLSISSKVHAAIVVACRKALPNECCGLLFGDDNRIDGFRETANVAACPDRYFEIDPAVLIAAIREDRAGGRRLIGYFHSHPNGSAEPSLHDAGAAARDGSLWIIVAGERMMAWRTVEGGERHDAFDGITLCIDDCEG